MPTPCGAMPCFWRLAKLLQVLGSLSARSLSAEKQRHQCCGLGSGKGAVLVQGEIRDSFWISACIQACYFGLAFGV